MDKHICELTCSQCCLALMLQFCTEAEGLGAAATVREVS